MFDCAPLKFMISGRSKQFSKQANKQTSHTHIQHSTISECGVAYQSELTCNPTHRLSKKDKVFCHISKVLSVIQPLGKDTANCVKGTHNTTRSKELKQEIKNLSPAVMAHYERAVVKTFYC